MAQSTSTVQNPSKAGKSEGHHLFAPEIEVMILTWVAFFSLLGILSKYAWNPILSTLRVREDSIRTAVEEAAKTKEEYLKIGDKRKQVLSEADQQAKAIVDQGREASIKNAKIIEEKTKQQAQIIMENAQREIAAEQEKAVVYLKEMSANTAVELATRILRESLDAEKQKKVNNTLIDEI